MKKQNIPRKKVSDGISLDIYKRCGWVPPDKKLSEAEELIKRKEFAIHNKASKKSIEILEKMCEDYEKNIWRPS